MSAEDRKEFIVRIPMQLDDIAKIADLLRQGYRILHDEEYPEVEAEKAMGASA